MVNDVWRSTDDGRTWGIAVDPNPMDARMSPAVVVVPASAVPEGFSDADLAELFITASVARSDSDTVTVTRTDESKCGRCWRLLPSVAEDGDLCDRCEDVVATLDGAE